MRTPEYRAKMSAAKKGPWTEEHLANHAAAMRRPDVIAKVSAAITGIPWTPEHKANQSDAMTGNTNGRGNLGQKHPGRGSHGLDLNPSANAIHKRLRKLRGRPSLCEHCGTTTAKLYHWAYTGHGHDTDPAAYSTNLDDYIRLCVSCHLTFDKSPRGHYFKHSRR